MLVLLGEFDSTQDHFMIYWKGKNCFFSPKIKFVPEPFVNYPKKIEQYSFYFFFEQKVFPANFLIIFVYHGESYQFIQQKSLCVRRPQKKLYLRGNPSEKIWRLGVKSTDKRTGYLRVKKETYFCDVSDLTLSSSI